MMARVSIVGLGKLGASMVAAIASRGGDVIGVDVNPDAVAAVANGRAPVLETDLDTTLAANRDRIRATLDVAEAVRDSTITFVIVPTPSDARGAFAFDAAATAFEAIGRALRTKDAYHVVVLTSTVLPGTTRQALLPVLERASGKRAGPDFGLCYSPEFIALGSVIRDFLNPDFTLIGEIDARAGETLETYYGQVMTNHAPARRMSIENAELAKISVNSFVTMKITFANMLAALCEAIPGADVDVVTQALGSDRRIGSRYLTGGLGYGGPCFPRDNVALAFLARALGTPALGPEATDAANVQIPARVVARIAPLVPTGGTVGILGLAYKPASHVVEAAQGAALAEACAGRGLRVVAFDPLVTALLGRDGVQMAASAAEVVEVADVVVIATPDPAFTAIDWTALLARRRALTIVDAWRLLSDRIPASAAARYHVLGRGPTPGTDANAEARLASLWTDTPAR
ncbi:MAG: nucleotide sugar dehydrogenase [Vicinamibacteraceae bacterium]